jgi:XTP/dITP diphosphohydrolase
MANFSDSSMLSVITVADCLSQPIQLTGPLVICPISTAAIAQLIAFHLQEQLPLDHPLTLIYTPSYGKPKTWQVPLAELGNIELLFPCSLYLSPPVTPTLNALQELIAIVAQLRSPQGGCPWDLAQTPESLTPYVIEEAYEVVDAIRRGEIPAIAEELGDLLLQVVLQAQIASETDQFSLQNVAEGISQKLIRRHPHVFADLQLENLEQVHLHWEQIKAQERGQNPALPVPLSQKLGRDLRTLPPLMASLKIAQKASSVGLDWPDISGVWDKFYEELAEFQQALEQTDLSQQQAELGDLLFTVINLGRWCQLDPEVALQGTCERFLQRLEKIEAAIDQPLNHYSLVELETLWQQAKIQLRTQASPPPI